MFHSFHNCCQSLLFSHRHKFGLKRQMKKKMQDICSKETKTTAASLWYLYADQISNYFEKIFEIFPNPFFQIHREPFVKLNIFYKRIK